MTSVERLLAVLALAAALAAAWAAPYREKERVVLAAVDVQSFAGLVARRPDAAGPLWERLRAMGISAAVLREETLADLSSRGEILSFTSAEVEKWRAAGLVSASSGLRGGTLLAKDQKSLTRAIDALAARGIDATTVTVSGSKAVEIPVGIDLARVPAGFDPGTVAALSSAGIIPVAISTSPSVSVAGHVLWTRTLPCHAKPGEILRAALSRPLRLIIFKPRTELGLEGNIEDLRVALRSVRQAGQPSTLPPVRPVDESDWSRRGRLGLVWFLGIAGTLLAVRSALQTARALRARIVNYTPLASPTAQVVAGMVVGWAVATFTGIAIAGVAPMGWRDGDARAWMMWTWCAPVVIGGSALFASRHSRRGWSSAVRRRDLAMFILFSLAAAMLLAPRASLRLSDFWESFDKISAAGVMWWWPWYWRVAVIGVPSLLMALSLIESGGELNSGEDQSTSAYADPRGWLILGLLGPAGLIAAIGGHGAPLIDSVVHGGMAWIIGLLLGLLLVGLRELFFRKAGIS